MQIQTIRMPILRLTIQKGFEAFECKFEQLERDSKHSNPNSNRLKGIRKIQIQIWTIRKRFEPFEWKFKPFERNSKHSNPNSNHSKGISMQILTIWNIWMQIWTKF